MAEPDNKVVTRAVAKLALAGEQAGLSVEDIIALLNAGISLDALLDVVCGQSPPGLQMS
ncbi:MAG TPA: hypothetical protein VHR84_11430 [Terriglobales bacterium]|nr:hypothetical protein [Terriglobales bacterium]